MVLTEENGWSGMNEEMPRSCCVFATSMKNTEETSIRREEVVMCDVVM